MTKVITGLARAVGIRVSCEVKEANMRMNDGILQHLACAPITKLEDFIHNFLSDDIFVH